MPPRSMDVDRARVLWGRNGWTLLCQREREAEACRQFVQRILGLVTDNEMVTEIKAQARLMFAVLDAERGRRMAATDAYPKYSLTPPYHGEARSLWHLIRQNSANEEDVEILESFSSRALARRALKKKRRDRS